MSGQSNIVKLVSNAIDEAKRNLSSPDQAKEQFRFQFKNDRTHFWVAKISFAFPVEPDVKIE